MTREGAALSMPRQPRVAAPTLPQFSATWELRREGLPCDGRDGLPSLQSRRRESMGETLALATSRPRSVLARVPLVQVRHSKVDRRRDGGPEARAVYGGRDSSGHSSGHIAVEKDNALARNLFSPGHLSG